MGRKDIIFSVLGVSKNLTMTPPPLPPTKSHSCFYTQIWLLGIPVAVPLHHVYPLNPNFLNADEANTLIKIAEREEKHIALLLS